MTVEGRLDSLSEALEVVSKKAKHRGGGLDFGLSADLLLDIYG